MITDLLIYNPFAWLVYSFLLMIAISYMVADDDDF